MTLAVKYPERFLAQVHRPVGWLGALLRPLRVLLGGLTALTVRLIGSERAAEPELSERSCGPSWTSASARASSSARSAR